MKKKDVSTINNSVYYENLDTISDSRKQVDPRNDKKETHIVDGVRTLSVGVRLFNPAVIGFIGQESTDLATHVLTNSSEQLSMKSLSLLNKNQSKTFVIRLACESMEVESNIICTFLIVETVWGIIVG